MENRERVLRELRGIFGKYLTSLAAPVSYRCPFFLRHSTVDYVDRACLPFRGPVTIVLWIIEMCSELIGSSSSSRIGSITQMTMFNRRTQSGAYHDAFFCERLSR